MRKIIPIILILAIFTGFAYLLRYTEQQKRAYEQTHNCKYDYNELCYTIEQKPHLFK